MRQFSKYLLASLVLAGLCVQPVAAGVVVAGFDATSFAANDDGSTGLVSIGFTANFFGTSYTDLYVNNNGNVTFDAGMFTYTPFSLLSTSTKIIAPFFADVDTRAAGSGLTKYGAGTYAGHTAFGVSWRGVGYYGVHDDKLNTFQLILTDRSDIAAGDFDIYFNYDQILWETGDASGGSLGLGGFSARAGYSNGVSASYELPGSAINGALLDGGSDSLIANTNDGTLGQFLFQVRNGVVVGVPDSGATVALLGLGLAGLLALRRRHG
jgi:hypothetical protein